VFFLTFKGCNITFKSNINVKSAYGPPTDAKKKAIKRLWWLETKRGTSKIIIFKEDATSAIAWFSGRSSILVEFEFGDVGFCGGRKTLGARQEPIPVTKPTHPWHQATMEPGPCSS